MKINNIGTLVIVVSCCNDVSKR